MASGVRRRLRPWAVLSPLLGLALAPTAAGALWAAGLGLGRLAAHPASTAWFLAGFGVWALLHASGILRLRRAYVFSHELTHALAAWMGGGKVFRFAIGEEGGHVDLSHANAAIALAPYWIPLYALAAVAAYRAAQWSGQPAHAREAFLFAIGAGLSFHLCHTVESLWAQRQSDLDHAGLFLSLSSIALLNGLLLLVAAKCLFPRLVSLQAALRLIARLSLSFWTGAAHTFRSARR